MYCVREGGERRERERERESYLINLIKSLLSKRSPQKKTMTYDNQILTKFVDGIQSSYS